LRYIVEVGDDARHAIRNTARYIAIEQHAPLNAERWLDALWTTVDGLESMPHRYPVDPIQTTATGRETRKLNFGDFLVFYHVDDQRHRVDIVSFVHGSKRQDT